MLAGLLLVGVTIGGAGAAPAITQAGTCTGFSDAKALGAAYTDSVVTVPACGPQPMLGGSLASLVPYPGGRTIAGYQCVEFAERFLYYRYGVKTLASTNGDQVVDHYAGWNPLLFKVIANGTAGQAPVEGDVLSFSDVTTFNGGNGGHTAVVQSSSVNSSGTGSITIIEENGGSKAATGSQVLTVSAWNVQYSAHPDVKWLHYVASTLPAKPTSPKVTSTTGTSAVLAWTDASDNESAFWSQYRIGGGPWITGPRVGADVTSMTIGGLAVGTAYTFQVGAHDTAGTHWSSYFYGTTVAVPAQPTNPKVTATTSTSATLTWTDTSNNETSFVSQYKVGNGSWTRGNSVGPGKTSMTVTGLTPGTTYTFQVGGANVAGTKWSAYVTGSTPQVLPAQPTNVRVSSTSQTTAVLAWTDTSNNETGFRSQYKIGSGAWVTGNSAGTNATSLTVTGLKPGTAYTFQVGSNNSVGTHWSAYVYGSTTTQPTPPPPPPTSGYHAGRQVKVDSHATGGVSGHKGPNNSYATGPTYAANTAIWIVCYVNGESITGPYNTTTIWDLADDGYYYTDAWLYTGTNGPAVPACAPKNVPVDSHATGGLSGHRGPDNSYATGPTHATNSSITIFCYVTGESITGPYNTTTIWDLLRRRLLLHRCMALYRHQWRCSTALLSQI